MPNLPRIWYQQAYRRIVIDMHIPDWDNRFLSQFNSNTFVDMLKHCKAQSAVVYAHSHVGLFNYPTQIGKMHSGLQGRDIFHEILELCHQNDISVVAYCSLIFDNWAYDNHKNWRIILANGLPATEYTRYGLCCPNAPAYKDYVVAFTREICTKYDIDGIRFDMTFWPTICYCNHCRSRYRQETGQELPEIVDWNDQNWVSFQRKREAWLVDFATLATKTVKKIKPEISIEHQSSTYTMNWMFGVTEDLSYQSHFLQGDFYGDALQGSVVRKLLSNLSEMKPIGFETSVSPSLSYHTGIKSADLLRAKARASLADNSAIIFIDAIDPSGTLNPTVYERIGKIFSETMPYDSHRGGQPCQDIAVYFSLASKFNPSDNGIHTVDMGLSLEAPQNSPHINAMVNACKALISHHLPFGIITRKNLSKLSQFRILILPNVLMMDQEEIQAIRDYVKNGGALYASKFTSIQSTDGTKHADFMLSDVFGVSVQGETSETFTYIAPTSAYIDLFPNSTKNHPLSVPDTQTLISPTQTAEADIIGELVLPYYDPADKRKFASIHSNPPGIYTKRPAIVFNRSGQGLVIYSSADIENNILTHDVFINLIYSFGIPFTFEVEAPSFIEATMFHQVKRRRYILNLTSFPSELPSIPVRDIRVKLRLHGEIPQSLLVLPEDKPLHFTHANNIVEFIAPEVSSHLMLALTYKDPL